MKLKNLFFLAASLFVCAQVYAGNPTVPVQVAVQTIPEGAKVYYKGQLVGATTPCAAILQVPKKEQKSDIVLTIQKEGYKTATVNVQRNFVRAGMFKIETAITVSVELEKDAATLAKEQKPYKDDPSIPQGEAQNRVTRDNAGQTALERTIIRWFFDSEPKGARIFWRVISSVPSEVKNTNELWLGSTPFEETRSFNIQGLTYENARDVQIEVKVTRKGYIDQTKRFNVRQAIDQQEISSFFDMIKDE